MASLFRDATTGVVKGVVGTAKDTTSTVDDTLDKILDGLSLLSMGQNVFLLLVDVD